MSEQKRAQLMRLLSLSRKADLVEMLLHVLGDCDDEMAGALILGYSLSDEAAEANAEVHKEGYQLSLTPQDRKLLKMMKVKV